MHVDCTQKGDETIGFSALKNATCARCKKPIVNEVSAIVQFFPKEKAP
jgi:hypothetical protein